MDSTKLLTAGVTGAMYNFRTETSSPLLFLFSCWYDFGSDVDLDISEMISIS